MILKYSLSINNVMNETDKFICSYYKTYIK